MTIPPTDLLAALATHVPSDADEAASLVRIRALLEAPDDPFARSNPVGHITGSAVVARPDGSAFLLVHHRKLGRWLQPGGHVDPDDASVLATALREVREETGLVAVVPALAGRVFDVDVHAIPARPKEPAHEHFDVRYLVTTTEPDVSADLAEVRAIAWYSLADALAAGADASLARALRKALAALTGAV